MKKRDWVISIIAGLILGIIALCFNLVEKTMSYQKVKAESKTDEIVNLMLKSHANWKTIKGQVTIIYFNLKDNDQKTYFNSFEIENPNKAWLGVTDEMNKSIIDWYANGAKTITINQETQSYQELIQQDFTNELALVPTDIGSIDKEVIYRHPMASFLPSPIGDYLYPTGFAQRQGFYKIIGEEPVIGRPTWIVDFTKQNENSEVTMNARYWVDQATGVILQANVFSTEPDTFGELLESISFQVVEFDQDIQEEIFDPVLAGLNKEELDSILIP